MNERKPTHKGSPESIHGKLLPNSIARNEINLVTSESDLRNIPQLHKIGILTLLLLSTKDEAHFDTARKLFEAVRADFSNTCVWYNSRMTAELAQPPGQRTDFDRAVFDGTETRIYRQADRFAQSLRGMPTVMTVLYESTGPQLRAAYTDITNPLITVSRFLPEQIPSSMPNSGTLRVARESGHRVTEGKVIIGHTDIYNLYEAANSDTPDYARRAQHVRDTWLENLVQAHTEDSTQVYYVPLPDGAVMVDVRQNGIKKGVSHSMTILERTEGDPLDMLRERAELDKIDLIEAPLKEYEAVPIQSSPMFERLFPSPE